MYLFVTVGTTNFDELIQLIDTEDFHNFLKNVGFTKVTLQIGNTNYVPRLIYKKTENIKTENKKIENNKIENNKIENNKIENKESLSEVKYFHLKNSIRKYLEKADVVLTHAGAGTTMECLRLRKINKKTIIIVNPKLMNNHQMEFAEHMEQFNYLEVCKNLKNLKQKISKCLNKTYEPFPEPTVEEFTRDIFNLIEEEYY